MPARFKLDKNLRRDAEAFLRTAGHDVHTVLGEHFDGIVLTVGSVTVPRIGNYDAFVAA